MMTEPKLSAVLNNCPLHALTPEIKREISRIANNEGGRNQNYPNYVELKRHFAEYYQLDPNALSWQQFAAILNEYNAFDVQIIMGPVLRSFMKNQLTQHELLSVLAEEQRCSPIEYVNKFTEIDGNTARYRSLSPDELFAYASNALGISLHYYPQNDKDITITANDPIAIVSIYHQGSLEGAQQGGHWERTPNETDRLDYQTNTNTKLIGLTMLLGNDPRVNPYGLNLLKKHIQLTYHEITEHIDLKQKFVELDKSTRNIELYVRNRNAYSKPESMKKLDTPISIDVEEFIEQFDPSQQITVVSKTSLSQNTQTTQRDTRVLGANPQVVTLETAANLKLAANYFEGLLALISVKIDQFKLEKDDDEKYAKAYLAAQNLYNGLKTARENYFNNNLTPEGYRRFILDCNEHISKNREVLETHRGWGQILVNTSLAILGLGIFYLIAGLIHKMATGKFLFFETDTANIIKEIEKCIIEKCIQEVNSATKPGA